MFIVFILAESVMPLMIGGPGAGIERSFVLSSLSRTISLI